MRTGDWAIRAFTCLSCWACLSEATGRRGWKETVGWLGIVGAELALGRNAAPSGDSGLGELASLSSSSPGSLSSSAKGLYELEPATVIEGLPSGPLGPSWSCRRACRRVTAASGMTGRLAAALAPLGFAGIPTVAPGVSGRKTVVIAAVVSCGPLLEPLVPCRKGWHNMKFGGWWGIVRCLVR